jgi:hypothetical protein
MGLQKSYFVRLFLCLSAIAALLTLSTFVPASASQSETGRDLQGPFSATKIRYPRNRGLVEDRKSFRFAVSSRCCIPMKMTASHDFRYHRPAGVGGCCTSNPASPVWTSPFRHTLQSQAIRLQV